MENLNIFDEDGNKIGEMERKEAHEKGFWHCAVTAFIVNDKNEILSEQVAKNGHPWQERWDISCGGHVSAGDDELTTIIRELDEELGLKINKNEIQLIGQAKSIVGSNKHHNKFFFIKKNINISDLKLQKEEISAVKWFPFEELKNLVEKRDKVLTEKWGAWDIIIEFLEKINNI